MVSSFLQNNPKQKSLHLQLVYPPYKNLRQNHLPGYSDLWIWGILLVAVTWKISHLNCQIFILIVITKKNLPMKSMRVITLISNHFLTSIQGSLRKKFAQRKSKYTLLPNKIHDNGVLLKCASKRVLCKGSRNTETLLDHLIPLSPKSPMDIYSFHKQSKAEKHDIIRISDPYSVAKL